MDAVEPMNASDTDRYGWPTPDQTLLLQAALQTGNPALDAWAAWRRGDIEKLDDASFRMLPLLYSNLRAQGVADPVLEVYKGVYRKTWYKNRLFLHRIAGVLEELGDAGIRTMTLKGAALAVLCYADPGLRPMDDFDVLVPAGQVEDAIGVLDRHGWSPQQPWPGPVTADYLCTRHAHNFRDAENRALDLHWHVLIESCAPGADDDFWAGALPMTLYGVPTLALSPADQLLHCCAHGSSWSPVPPMRWAADAATLIRKPYAPLDWDRFVAQAQKRHLVLTMLGALLYLARLDVAIPQEVVTQLETAPVSRLERSAYHTKTRCYSLLGWWPALWYRYLLYSPLHDGRSRAGRLAAFPRYLQHTWELPGLRYLPSVAFARGMRRLARGLWR